MLKPTARLLTLSALCLGVAACAPLPHQPQPAPVSPPQEFSSHALINQGALCLTRQANSLIQINYLPLATTCASSSLNRWENPQLAARLVNSAKRGQAIRVETAITHLQTHSPVATADCAGAYVGSTQLATTSRYAQEVFWGKQAVGRLPGELGAMLCVRLDANGQVTAAPELQEQMR